MRHLVQCCSKEFPVSLWKVPGRKKIIRGISACPALCPWTTATRTKEHLDPMLSFYSIFLLIFNLDLKGSYSSAAAKSWIAYECRKIRTERKGNEVQSWILTSWLKWKSSPYETRTADTLSTRMFAQNHYQSDIMHTSLKARTKTGQTPFVYIANRLVISVASLNKTTKLSPVIYVEFHWEILSK